MAQRAQFIDLTRTYLPIDPASYPENLTTSDTENQPEKRIPVMAFEGHNFMPTSTGYRSYFGLNSQVDLEPLPANVLCDHQFMYQKADYTSIFVALCGDGIYINTGVSSQEPWTKVIDILEPSTQIIYKPWSMAVIGSTVYMYMQGALNMWRIQRDSYQEILADGSNGIYYDAYEITPVTPSFINMAGQMGIFKAGGRLGFWDSDDSVGWSSFENLLDCTPSISTQANITKFVDVVGRIVTIKQHGDGFIIYATKSIVHVFKDLTNTFLWKTQVLSTNVGVAYAKQVAVANPDVYHFVWGTNGLIQIVAGKPDQIGTEFYDYLKESGDPILLSILCGRYLFVEMMNEAFVAAQISSYTSYFPVTDVMLTDYVAARNYLVTGAQNLPAVTIAQLYNLLRDPNFFKNITGKTYSTGYIDTATGHTYDSTTVDVTTYDTFDTVNKSDHLTLSNGNKTMIADASNFNLNAVGNQYRNTGILFFEVHWDDTYYSGITYDRAVGLANSSQSITDTNYPGNTVNSWGYVSSSSLGYSSKIHNGTPTVYGGAWFTVGMVIGCKWDVAAQTLEFFRNGVSQGVAYTGVTGPLRPMIMGTKSAASATINFGETAWAYPANAVGATGWSTTVPVTTVDGPWPYFATTATAVTTVVGTSLITANAVPNSLYGGTNYIPNVPAINGGSFPTNLFSKLTTSNLTSSSPSTVTDNTLTGYRIPVDGANDTFTKARIAWAQERAWQKEFVDGLSSNVNAYVPVTDTSTATGLTNPNLRDAITQGDNVGVDTIEGTLYYPNEVYPEHFELNPRDNSFHMYQAVKNYKKVQIVKTVTKQPVIITQYIATTPDGVQTFASLAAFITYMEDRSVGFGGSKGTLVSSVAAADTAFYGENVYGGTTYTYNGKISFVTTADYSASVYNWRGTVNVVTSYRTVETIVDSADDSAVYHAFIPSNEDVPEAQTKVYSSSWTVGGMNITKPTIGAGAAPIPPITYPDIQWTINSTLTFSYPAQPEVHLTFPAGSFLMQVGSPSPAYVTMTGAFVYDMYYKRWGKMKTSYIKLVDYTPLNTQSEGLIPYTQFGVEGAVLKPDGILYSFDANPSDSYIKYGKVGMSRIGETSLEEVHAQFRLESTGQIETETSLDGKNVDSTLTKMNTFSHTKLASLFPSTVGKWHNISLKGQYDLTYLEYRSYVQGRR